MGEDYTMRICVLAYTTYKFDNRVRRCAEALSKRGDQVDVIAIRKELQSKFEIFNNVNVYNIQRRRHSEKSGKFSYLFRLLRFAIKSSMVLTVKHIRKSYDIIHVHSVPDFEVFAAWFCKLFGSKIILDIHDIVPEFYSYKFNTSNKSFIFKILVLIEKVSIAFSDHVIIANHIWEQTLISRSVKKSKCTVILNYPDPSIFYKRPRTRNDNKFIIIYPGTVYQHQGLDIAVKAFSIIKDQIPLIEFHIYGNGPELNTVSNLVSKHKLDDRVFINKLLPLDQIADVMANADLGIVPKRNDSFGKEAFSTKILEFMALGIPVLISKTEIDEYYFNDNIVKFFESGNIEDLADCIMMLYKNQRLRINLVDNANKFVEGNNWDIKKIIYFEVLDKLTNQNKNVQGSKFHRQLF